MSNENPIHPCWKLIGVWGDGKCPELPRHIHCRNCETYADAAARLLDREPPRGYFEEWTARIAQPRQPGLAGTKSIVIFALGGEWMALPTTVFQEVAELRPIHSLPHRSDGIIKGLVNIRGELLICVSLRDFLSLGTVATPARHSQRAVYERLLVVAWQGERLVFAVDEVTAGQRYHPDALQPLPSTLALATGRYSIGLLPWRDRNVGVLDEALLFPSLNRHLA
jgi:chemotaxis-related protein WspD